MRRSVGLGLLSTIIVTSLAVLGAQGPRAAKAPATASAATQATSLPTFDVFMKPVMAGGTAVTEVGVRLEIGDVGVSPRSVSVRIPIVFAGVPGIADSITAVSARDSAGPVDLARTDDPPDSGNFMYFRHWKTSRTVSGRLTIEYVSRLPQPRPRSGPPFELRSNGGGVSGAGAGFLLLPEGGRPFHIQLHWDLSQLPKGASAATSLGEGDVRLTAPPDPLLASFYLAGPLGRYVQPDGSGFSAAWLGTLPFDSESTFKWTATAYQQLVKFFRDSNPAPFRVFFRVGADNEAPGGAALTNSFLMFLPPVVRDANELRHTIVHEMVHHWGSDLDRSKGESNWFAEGTAEHYSRVLPFRAGLMTPEQYLADVDHTVVRFYSNPLCGLPDAEIEARFWRDRNSQVLPYDRGAMYLAHLDGRLRTATQGRRSVDDVVLEMLEAKKTGKPAGDEAWLSALEKDLGPSVRDEFQRIIVKPQSWEPDPNAFGPCFSREAATYRTFDIGFDEWGTLYATPRVVKGLVPGSQADRAGLRNGDVILQPLDLSFLRSNPDAHVTMKVRRGAEEVAIDYLPRSATTVPGYRWVRNSGVTDQGCRGK